MVTRLKKELLRIQGKKNTTGQGTIIKNNGDGSSTVKMDDGCCKNKVVLSASATIGRRVAVIQVGSSYIGIPTVKSKTVASKSIKV